MGKNSMGKGENVVNQYFLLCPQRFQTLTSSGICMLGDGGKG